MSINLFLFNFLLFTAKFQNYKILIFIEIKISQLGRKKKIKIDVFIKFVFPSVAKKEAIATRS